MLKVTPIPAFQDNYLWLIRAADGAQAAVVDPGDAGPVIQALEDQGLTLASIVITHHHMDHVGGVNRLLERYPGIPVFGPAGERIPGITRRLREGDEVTLPGIQGTFKIFDVPGHTAGHIAYYGEGVLFCGDTLFACGCGRLFEGTAGQMYASLSKLAALPGDTRVYCAHEYTLANIAFAVRVEPDNPDLLQRRENAQALRRQGIPTVPSHIDLELQTNPFLRCAEPGVVAAAKTYSGRPLQPGAEVLGVVRGWKDNS